MKKAAAAILCGAMLTAVSAHAECPANANKSGEQQNSECIQLTNGNGIPAGSFLEALGLDVDYDNGCVRAGCGNTQICLYVGERGITVNGESIKLDDVPFTEQGRAYLPFKAIGYILNGCGGKTAAEPTKEPAVNETGKPASTPSVRPTAAPTARPTAVPTAVPTATPTAVPTAVPTVRPTVRPTAAPTVRPTAAPSVSSERDMEKRVLDLVNNVRSQYGLGALTWAEDLAQVARSHSSDMIRRNFFDHTNPDGRSPFDRLKAAGISYRTAAENIAYGQRSPEEVMNAWMNSSGHRANILNANVKEMGVGAVKNTSGTIYWTQMFVAR